MKIRGWSIEGYGTFRDYEIRDLDDGLTVFLGPNEAGKTTLLSFLRGVLFGFPDGRSKEPLYPPLRGGRHLGRVFLANGGGEYVVERQAGARRFAQVTLPGGGIGAETDLQRLLGGADSKLFRSVFAFSLSELQELSSLTDEGVSEQIFSAGIAGAGRSARSAIKELDGRTAELLKHGRGNARINNLEHDLTEIDGSIEAARRNAAQYGALLESEQKSEQLVGFLGGQIGALEQEARRLETLIGLWPVRSELDSANTELTEIRSGAKLEKVAGEAESLLQTIELYRDRLDHLPGEKASLENAEAQIGERLRELGEDWSEARLSSFDTSIPAREVVREWEVRLGQADIALREAESALTDAEKTRQTAEKTLERSRARLPMKEPLPLKTIEESERILARLRANLTDLRSQEARVLVQPQRQSLIPSWVARAVAVLSLGVLSTVGLYFASAGSTAIRVVLGVSLLATIAVGARDYAISRRRATEGAIEPSTGRAVPPPDLSAAVGEDAGLLDLESPPSSQALEERWNTLERERQDRQRWDDLQLALSETETDLATAVELKGSAEVLVEEARNGVDQEQAAWSDWKKSQGLPGSLGIDGAIDFFDAIRTGRDLLLAKERAEKKLAQLESEIDGWEKRARTTLKTAGRATKISGEALVEAVAELDRDCERRSRLIDTVRRCEKTIEDSLGQGEIAEKLRVELSSGEIDSWNQRNTSIELELVGLRGGHEEAIRQHQDDRNARKTLEESADLPELETKLEALREELSEATREWRVATIAKALIEETLREFERTRQPQVIANAQKSFESVTDGRYKRLAQDFADDQLAIFDDSGRRKSPFELSRGTAEQLYLCIRLGLAAEFAARSCDLPLVMDDVLVNFDADRSKATAELIAEFSRDHQVLLFTCHPTTCDLLEKASDAEVRVVEMARAS